MAIAKHWVFTVFADEVSFFDSDKVQYCIFGNEKCPKTGRWHKQGYVCLKKKSKLSALKKFDKTAHFEVKRGTVLEAIEYCKKDGDYYEFGDPPVEERSNANVYADCIIAAERGDLEYIKKEHPGQFLRYKRTFEGLIKYPCEQLAQPRGYWVFGTPGCGKDSSVLALNPFVKSHSKWWDGYQGEKYILLSDFTLKDAEFLSTYLLQWTDRYPFTAEYKGGSFKICPERFYVTSNFSLEQMFGTHPQYEAYVRRFHVINYDTKQVTKRPEISIVPDIQLVDF